MKAPIFVLFAVLAVASAADICQRTTCDYSPHTNSQGATLFRTKIYSNQQPGLENFHCGKVSGSNDCECLCDPTYKCTLAHDADGAGDVKSFDHCEPEPTEKAVPLLLQLKMSSSTLQSQWSALTDQTTDLELNGLGLPGVTMNPNHLLEKLTLTNVGLSGTIPSFEANTALQQLDLSWNTLTGPIPSFAANTALSRLTLNQNQLTGPIPSFASDTALEQLKVDFNKLTGPIPSFAANTALTQLYLHYNRLTGAIPSFSANTALYVLYLRENQLTGTIPSFAANKKLRYLYLQNNQLTGTIPSFAANTGLSYGYLGLYGNNLTDPAGWSSNTANYPRSVHVQA